MALIFYFPGNMNSKSAYNLRLRSPTQSEGEKSASVPECSALECSECHKTFSRGDTLRAHVKSAHKVSSRRCQICRKQFPTVFNLQRHTLIHSEVKNHQCSVCLKSFSRLDNLKAHEATHQDVEYKCQECDETFSTKLALMRHSRARTDAEYTHKSGEETCDMCSVSVGASTHIIFQDHPVQTTLGLLKRHMRHQCTYCFKVFTCFCTKEWFGFSSSFYDHFKKRHAGKNIHRKVGVNCSFCTKLSSTKQQSQRHEKQCCKNPEAAQKKERSASKSS